MKIAKWILWGLAALCFLLLLFCWLSPLFAFPQASSIGVIGGADGPTAIFVTSVFHPEWALGGLTLVFATAGAILHFIGKRKPFL